MVKGRYTYYIERGISAQGQGQKHMVCTKYYILIYSATETLEGFIEYNGDEG